MHYAFGMVKMRTAAKLSDSISDHFNETVADRPSEPHSNRSYARELRVVGQLLESHGVVSLDLVLVDETYLIRGKVGPGWRDRSSDHSVGGGWIARFGLLICGQSKSRSVPGETVELRYNLGNIVAFESQVRSRRDEARGMPNPYALSQVLRSAGAYLDTRNGSSLIGISLRERWMKIRFETGDGRLEEAHQDIEYFYDYWVKMYLRRNTRAQANFFAV